MREYYSQLKGLCTFFVITAVLLTFVGCKQSEKQEQIVAGPIEFPFTTTSSEALASFNAGIDLLDVGNGQQARIHFTKAIELDSSFASAYIFRSGAGSDIYQSGASPSDEHFKNDLRKAAKNIEGKSDGEKILSELYRTYLNNNTEERIRLAEQLTVIYPTCARAFTILGDAYDNISNHQKSREQYQKAIDLDSGWVGGYFSIATSYMNVEPRDYKKAEENFLKVVELKPDLPGSHIYLGDAYRAQNNLEKARTEYEKALAIDPNDALTYFKSGHVNSYLGAYDNARSDYRKASELNPENRVAPINFEAYTYLYAGDFKTAKSWLEEKARSINKLSLQESQFNSAKNSFLDNCARIAFHMEDAKEVSRFIGMMKPISEKIGEGIGTEEAKLQNKANILVWESYILAMKGDYSAATAKAEEAKTTVEPVKNANKLWNYHAALSYISFKQGNFDDAVSHQEQSDPNEPYSKYRLALACEKAGQAERATKLYNELVDYNFNKIGYALIRKELKEKAKSA
jgi:tetratricopeptide (TPR) repeat protein